MARRQRRQLMGKMGVKKADTNITNAGSGAAPGSFNILETQGGARDLTGATQTIKSSADTGEVCNVGDMVKYVNLFIQCGPRASQPNLDKTGWLEWALVMVKETETAVPITTTGTQTLGAICSHMFRNECIYTGCIPVGQDVPNYVEVKIKVPKTKNKITLGDEWRLIHWFRATDAASVSAVAVRVVKSFAYKCYS